MFGDKSIIEILLEKNNNVFNLNNKINKGCFIGNNYKNSEIIPYKFNCDYLKINRDRDKIINNLKNNIDYAKGYPYHTYINILMKYKYAIDLLGVGCPNKRTFEILSSGTLIISQKDDLVWPFDDEFSLETKFETDTDYIDTINLINSDDNIYHKCLNQQNNIFNKYMNCSWIRNYILSKINI
jgi:hypothetical protein